MGSSRVSSEQGSETFIYLWTSILKQKVDVSSLHTGLF